MYYTGDLYKDLKTEETAIWNKIDLNTLSDNEIKGLIVKCTEIDKARQDEKKKELIKKLEEAFYNVKQANIRISVLDYDYGDIELTALSRDDFYFEY